MNQGISQQIEYVPLGELRLDPQNPRLPESQLQDDPESLLNFIDAEYDPLTIAKSIARHGYFASEPLICVRENGALVVVEGNRRLVALKGLAEESTRESLRRPEVWRSLAEESENLPAFDRIPVIVAENRRSVAPLIGYRHISGIEPWDPYPKARFIASLVDDQDRSFEEVAEEIGESVSTVRGLYRNQAVLRQARQGFGLRTDRAEEKFGVFNAAMYRPAVRDFIEAPAQPERGELPLPEETAPRVAQLFSYLFGDHDKPAVISESRDIRRLAHVLSSESGREVLETTRNLDLADEAAGGPLERLLNRLRQASNALRAAQQDLAGYAEEAEVRELLEDCEQAISTLREIQKTTTQRSD
jgi:hypothetical protein